jgi:mono/diheme cytochrome c family protein
MLAGLAGPVAAQKTGNGVRSTASGVYTIEQAARGEETFAGMCQVCHVPTTHTGPVFWASWGGRPLSELFAYISQSMPKSDPGSLSRGEYAQVLAFLLKMNGMPPGTEELPGDTVALKAIRFDSASPPAPGSRPR